MSRPDPENVATPHPTPPTPPWLLPVVGVVAVLVLVIGLVVWIGSRDDETITSATVGTTAPTATAVGDTAATSPTTVPPTTSPATSAPTTVAPTTLPSATVPASTVPPTTLAPTTTLAPGPSGDTWTITSPSFPDQPFTLRLVAQADGVSAYDGTIDVPPAGMRCVAVVVDGGAGWSESCGEQGVPLSFVVIEGIDPWLVEIGAEPGAVTLTRQDPQWTLPTNGCTAPLSGLLEAMPGGGLIGSPVMTGIICVPGEAFVRIGSELLKPGTGDGGGALITLGDEGWASRGAGTSFGCDDLADGVDRCALYGVEFELFEALLPIPPSEANAGSTDVVALTDETATAAGWIGGVELDPASVDALIVFELAEPEAEVAPTVTRASSGGWNLLVVEVPAMDDSVLSTTWAAWITSGTPSSVTRMYSWQTCARGIAAPDICL